ncbi:MAG: ABC transporter ATP-binding protein [Clostridia bacterium]|nr:ABC transporter ATP-binding protein [Clostridia bacterium]
MKKKQSNFREKVQLLTRHLYPARKAFALGISAALASTVLNALFTQIIRFTIDTALIGDQTGLPGFLSALSVRGLLAAACVAAVTVSLLRFAVSYVQDVSLPRGSEQFVKSLRDTLYTHIQRLPYSWHVKNPTGDIIQRCTSDVEKVRAFIAEQMLELLTTMFLMTVYTVIMFTMDVKISLVAFGFVPLILLQSAVYHKRIEKSFTEADEAEGALSSVVQENLTGVRVVRAFGRERSELNKFREKNERYCDLWLRLGATMSTFWTMGDALSMLQILSVIVLGVNMCVRGDVSLGTYLAFVSYTRSLTWPVRGLGRVISEMSKVGVSIDRLLYILKSEEEIVPDSPKTCDLHGEIRFDNVSFAYEEKKVLDGVSFTLPGGKTLGILGETGSGKSTVALLLARLYDADEGRITIGGVDVRDMDQHELRKRVGVVLQEPFLFSRTIEENIAIASAGAGKEDIAQAAKDACLDSAIGEFKEGYETVVGERGVTLSGGQKQRTAIARTLLTKAPIMVFDDALSAVDAKTDEAIRTRLREAAGDSTLILIAHRVSTLMQADEIIVLEHGKIIERGDHASLMEKNGVYARVAKMQGAAGEAIDGGEVSADE